MPGWSLEPEHLRAVTQHQPELLGVLGRERSIHLCCLLTSLYSFEKDYRVKERAVWFGTKAFSLKQKLNALLPVAQSHQMLRRDVNWCVLHTHGVWKR